MLRFVMRASEASVDVSWLLWEEWGGGGRCDLPFPGCLHRESKAVVGTWGGGAWLVTAFVGG